MRLLGIDYGRKKIGLALSVNNLAEPYMVIYPSSFEDAVAKIGGVAEREQAEKIVVGISEGAMAEETKRFAGKLSTELGIETVLGDETLSSRQAQGLAIEAGIKRSKRKKMEDAFAATVMLQLFIDKGSNV
jgi:putative Holliday junction resolvase